MKVGLYNRWLSTLGGGERYSLSIAETLARRHQVTVLSHEEVPRNIASERLQLNLSGVEFRTIPDYSHEQLEQLSGHFDLFFNASFMTYFPVKAPLNVFIVFFPSPLRWDFSQRFRRVMGFSLKRIFMVPTFENCLFQIQPAEGVPLFKTDLTARMHLPGSRLAYSLQFLLSGDHPEVRKVSLVLDRGPEQTIELDKPGRFVPVRVNVPAGSRPVPHRLVLRTFPAPGLDRTDIQVRHLLWKDLQSSHPGFWFFSKLFSRGFPGLGPRLYSMKPQPSSFAEMIGSYQQIWAISQFTQQWIRTYWNRESHILYPPVEVQAFAPAPKEKRILNVGRFFAGGHSKKHKEMIAAFKAMVREGLEGWELHLAGGTKPEPEHQAYLKEVYRQARDLPVVIHPDISFPELTRLYGTSSLYWHASGYREKEEREPHKSEHFGITTVEAMASGCIPVVIGKGGQPEIVRPGENGFLWQNLSELKQYSWDLIRNEALRSRLSRQAVADSRSFDRKSFNATLNRLLSDWPGSRDPADGG